MPNTRGVAPGWNVSGRWPERLPNKKYKWNGCGCRSLGEDSLGRRPRWPGRQGERPDFVRQDEGRTTPGQGRKKARRPEPTGQGSPRSKSQVSTLKPAFHYRRFLRRMRPRPPRPSSANVAGSGTPKLSTVAVMVPLMPDPQIIKYDCMESWSAGEW